MKARSLHVQQLRLDELLARSEAWRAGLLGVAAFGVGEVPAALRSLDVPLAIVRAPLLGEPAWGCEVWWSPRPARSGRAGPVRWRDDGEVMFIAATDDGRQSLQAAAEQVYCELFATVAAQGYGHLLRVWNHVGDINAQVDGLERYRQFNIGRQQAFLASGRQVAGSSVPAASALGASAEAPLLVYALAARKPALAIENPRQVSAYHYPEAYGPRAPTFSRASLAEFDSPFLFVSGTASIVGHESRHLGDVREQTRETLRNIAAVLVEARARRGVDWQLADLQLKVYLRRAGDRPVVQQVIREMAGSEVPCRFVQADVCRSELLVEIEAVARQTSPVACAV